MKEQEAYEYFQNKKFNCCESLLLAYGQDFGLPKELIPKIGTGFGGGYAHQGLICGVLNAATILLNLKYGRSAIEDGRLPANFEKVEEFFHFFKEEYGSIFCKTITKTNFAREDKFQEWVSSGGRNECANLIRKSAMMLEKIAGI